MFFAPVADSNAVARTDASILAGLDQERGAVLDRVYQSLVGPACERFESDVVGASVPGVSESAGEGLPVPEVLVHVLREADAESQSHLTVGDGVPALRHVGDVGHIVSLPFGAGDFAQVD